mmetsp:Transcript_36978/g.74788  ORF Transcript_36978/g.74788 Transcript_36978/m.74788 type:complete len:318 (+) Transcript_36978:210-1163(+)
MDQAFTRSAVESYVPGMMAGVDQAMSKLRTHAASGEVTKMYDLHEQLYITTSWINLVGPIPPAQEKLLSEAFVKISPGLFSPPSKLFPPYKNAMEARETILRELQTIITSSKRDLAQGRPLPKTVLYYLLTATEEDGSPTMLSDEEVASELIVMLFGGFLTSASTSTSFLLETARRPAMRDMLLDEQQKLLEQSGDVASQLNSMPALDAAIQEILRYRPAVPGAFRRCVRDTEYEGYHIPAGTKITAGSFLANRSPKIAGTAGGDPEKYCPMRYLASPTKDARPHLAFSVRTTTCLRLRLQCQITRSDVSSCGVSCV